jgi:uncharacterized protein (TIGR02569 family)
MHVLRAFGATGDPERLSGGRGLAWRAGDRILKPVDIEPTELEWQAANLTDLRIDGCRLALPTRAPDGALVVDGWTAWPTLAGRHEPGRWIDIIDVGRRFHAALAGIGRPQFIDERRHRWAMGDRVAWDEIDDAPYRTIPYVAELRDGLRPIRTASQLVHGDLTGNVLFADHEAPAIIDLALYWRSTAYATAIVVADAIVWEGAGEDLFGSQVGGETDFGALFARALIFRLVAAGIGGSEDRATIVDRYGVAVELAQRAS